MLSQFLLSAFYFPYFVKKYLNYSNNIRIFKPFQRFEYIRTFFKISNNIRIRIRKFSDLRIIFGFVKKKRFDHLCRAGAQAGAIKWKKVIICRLIGHFQSKCPTENEVNVFSYPQ